MWHAILRDGPSLTINIECRNSKQCAPAKHHFDECVERVTKAEADGDNKEDCVEECMSYLSTPPSCLGNIH